MFFFSFPHTDEAQNSTLIFTHFADAFIQRDLQMKNNTERPRSKYQVLHPFNKTKSIEKMSLQKTLDDRG